jgi:hypothetical protein
MKIDTFLAAALVAFLSGVACGYSHAQPACSAPWETAQAHNANGSTTAWTAVCSTDPRDGGGGFVQFLTPNKAGKMLSGVTLNGGLLTATPGQESSDIDIDGYYEGKTFNFSIFGNYGGIYPPGIGCWPPDLCWVGNQSSRMAGFYGTPVKCPPSVPGNPTFCIKVNDGYTPYYK